MRRIIQMLLVVVVLFPVFACKDESRAVAHESETTVQETVERPEQETDLNENHDGYSLDIATMNDEEMEAFLIGIWYIFYPTPNQNWGHDFSDDHSYEYWDQSLDAMQNRYRFTVGKWRINEDTIQVQLSSYQIADRDAEEDIFGYGFPSDTEYINVSVEDDNWYTIGTLESIRTGIVKYGQEFPPRITLHPLMLDEVLDEEVQYWRNRP